MQRNKAQTAFVTLTGVQSIIAFNRKKLVNVFSDAQESWDLLKMHLINGWKAITDYHVNREKKGLILLSKMTGRNQKMGKDLFFYNLRVSRAFIAHLAYMEKRFGMFAGELKPQMYGRYTLDDRGKIGHIKTEDFLGLNGLRSNHAMLLVHYLKQKIEKRAQSDFFHKVFYFIRVKEFVIKLDVAWHRTKARKGVKALKDNWIMRIHSNNRNLQIISNLINNDFQKSRSEDLQEFMAKRKSEKRGEAIHAGILKLRDIMNKQPNNSVNHIEKDQSNFKNQKSKQLQIIEGCKVLKNIQNNLKNWGNCKLKTFNHSGLLKKDQEVSSRLQELKLEHKKNLILQSNLMIQGTIKRHVRNSMNHFFIRLLNKNIILNKILLGEKKIRASIELHGFLNLKKAFDALKIPKKQKKPTIDPQAVLEFAENIKYLFDNRLSQGMGSIQSYVMKFEVLKIEEISNHVQLDSGGVRNLGEAYNRIKGAQLQAEQITSKYYGNRNVLSNNSIDSK